MSPSVIRAGKSNLFLSEVFTEAFVNATNVPVELYENDGSVGAAIGAGIGANIFTSVRDAFRGFKPIKLIEPKVTSLYEPIYQDWKNLLEGKLV